MKFKSLLLVVGFIPALAMAEIAKPAPEKPPAVVARPAPVANVYHIHIHNYHSGAPQIPKSPMEGGARGEMMEQYTTGTGLPKGEIKSWDAVTQSVIIMHLPPPPSLGCY